MLPLLQRCKEVFLMLLGLKYSIWKWDFWSIFKIVNIGPISNGMVWSLLWIFFIVPLLLCSSTPVYFMHSLVSPLLRNNIILSFSLKEPHPQHLSFKSCHFSICFKVSSDLPPAPVPFWCWYSNCFKILWNFSYDCTGDTVPNKAYCINTYSFISVSLVQALTKFLKMFNCKIIRDGS